MDSFKTIKIQPHKEPNVCINCGNPFYGKICNECGEKLFKPEQLSVKYFFNHTVDIFTHFENKVLKSIWLSIKKPGFITKENLRGVRVPYAKPIQLFIVVNIIFYLFVSYMQRTDYVPSVYDTHSSFISNKPLLNWVEPLDNAIARSVDKLRDKKLENFSLNNIDRSSYKIYRRSARDTTGINTPSEKQRVFLNNYDQKVAIFSKTLVFLLIPVFGFLFYIFFHKRLKYFGSALILATHFLVFNLLFYIILSAINFLPQKLFGSKVLTGLPYKSVDAVLYNEWMYSFSHVVFGLDVYEALHTILWGVWLFIAFKRLFNLPWWQNILISYFLSRLFFILIFGLFKKFLIAFSLWSM